MMEESGESTAFCTYCQIDTREPSPSRDLSDYWQEPDSFFLISGWCSLPRKYAPQAGGSQPYTPLLAIY